MIGQAEGVGEGEGDLEGILEQGVDDMILLGIL